MGEELNSRKAELKAMAISDLKALVSERALECGSSKEKLIAAVLEHEAKIREDAKAFDKKADEVIVQKKVQLEGKTATEKMFVRLRVSLLEVARRTKLPVSLSRHGPTEKSTMRS